MESLEMLGLYGVAGDVPGQLSTTLRSEAAGLPPGNTYGLLETLHWPMLMAILIACCAWLTALQLGG